MVCWDDIILTSVRINLSDFGREMVGSLRFYAGRVVGRQRRGEDKSWMQLQGRGSMERA